MWMDLYVTIALVVAVVAWLVSRRFQSYDPPSDLVRGFFAGLAGALWPLVIVGAAQVLAVRFVARRLSPDNTHRLDLNEFAARQDLSLRS
ncbi:hypothetical protein BayCH28_03930 [Mycolicibacterium sp. CH28]|uniref:hypothetical protein n=1 Tax=Mycolicibacterium sp. CH28 TaxID=2512237 RepID=UPI00108187BF|nr:hypothetical protein [Mycolicibacterium sp. CH28]TGD89754.1 hypothetical protein BayCH28_03930 [Mycolicibacterium sp. CH28]